MISLVDIQSNYVGDFQIWSWSYFHSLCFDLNFHPYWFPWTIVNMTYVTYFANKYNFLLYLIFYSILSIDTLRNNKNGFYKWIKKLIFNGRIWLTDRSLTYKHLPSNLVPVLSPYLPKISWLIDCIKCILA